MHFLAMTITYIYGAPGCLEGSPLTWWTDQCFLICCFCRPMSILNLHLQISCLIVQKLEVKLVGVLLVNAPGHATGQYSADKDQILQSVQIKFIGF